VGAKQDSLNLAQIIPVFPLPNVVLFPKVHLPLHIFEPRYRQMVKDAAANHRLIGMALLRGNWEKVYHRNPDIYPVGCAGEIISVTPFPDGRYNIVLCGLKEYEIKEHILDQTSYRQAKVVLREEPRGKEPTFSASLKREIFELVQQTLEEKESDLLKVLADPSLNEETWLNLCSFSLDISTLEKQSLLEAKSLEERATYLLNVLHFKVVEKGTPFEGLREVREKKIPH
jgi:Lon protease-like protein